MNKRYHNLVGRDDPMFEESGSSVALRFEVGFSLLHRAFVASADAMTVARVQVLESPGTLSVCLFGPE